jgi:hypothetical protein
MTSPSSPRRTPDWLLERIALGEMPPDRLQRARAQLLAEPDGAARLAALERSSAEILHQHPPAAVVAAVRARASQPVPAPARDPLRSLFTLGLPVAAAAAVVVAVGLQALAPAPADLRVAPPVEDTRLKGLRPHLLLHRLTATGVEALDATATARAGDRLQLQLVAAAGQHAVVLSIDGRGRVTLHLPEQGALAMAVPAGGELALPSSYELDDAPLFERFFLVTADGAFDVADVERAGRLLATDPARAQDQPLELDASLRQSSLLLRKVVE